MKKIIIILTLLFISEAVLSAHGSTSYAVPTKLEVVRGQGFMVFGDFGNPGECSTSNTIWVPIEHPQYDQLYSTALTAFTANKKIQAYIHSCVNMGWHGGTQNTLSAPGAMYLSN